MPVHIFRDELKLEQEFCFSFGLERNSFAIVRYLSFDSDAFRLSARLLGVTLLLGHARLVLGNKVYEK